MNICFYALNQIRIKNLKQENCSISVHFSCSVSIWGTMLDSSSSRTVSKGLHQEIMSYIKKELKKTYWNVDPVETELFLLLLLLSALSVSSCKSFSPPGPTLTRSSITPPLWWSTWASLNMSPIWSSSDQIKFFRSSLTGLLPTVEYDALSFLSNNRASCSNSLRNRRIWIV